MRSNDPSDKALRLTTPLSMKKRRIWMWVLIIVVALCIIGVLLPDGEQSGNGSVSTSSGSGASTTSSYFKAESTEVNAQSAGALAYMRENGPDGREIIWLTGDDALAFFGEPDKTEDEALVGGIRSTWSYSNYDMEIVVLCPTEKGAIDTVARINISRNAGIPIYGIDIGDDWESAVNYLISIGYIINTSETRNLQQSVFGDVVVLQHEDIYLTMVVLSHPADGSVSTLSIFWQT